MSKKVLAILGSPHKIGTTATMLDHAINRAQEKGYQVTNINLYEKNIGYCKGCKVCHKTQECVIKDDIIEITKSMKESDIIILAAPVYWANVPGVVKNMFDRLCGVAMEDTKTFPKPHLKGKEYLLLTSCTTPAPFSYIFGQSRGAFRNMNEFFKTAGMKCIGRYCCSGMSAGKKPKQNLLLKIRKSL